MLPPQDLVFPPFHLDAAAQCLRRGPQVIALRRKTFALLRDLVAHAGELVTKDAVLAAVWPETQVSEGGQCIEQFGAGEAYLPVLEALGRLGRAPEGHRVIKVLAQYAPTWLAQLPALLSMAESAGWQRQVVGATRERMLREMAEAVEALTVERLLVLVLEDLHWSDVAMLDLLSVLARRREPARLLVIGTYRPVEVIVRAHPLKTVHEALTFAHAMSLPLSYTVALNSAAAVYHFRREERAMQEQVETAIALATEHGFPLLRARAVILRGWLLAAQGQGEDGLALLRQGLAASLATGAETGRSYFLALLAEAYSNSGQPAAGLPLLAEALAGVDKTGARFWEVELYRLKGQLTLQLETRGWRLETSPPSSQASSLKPQVSSGVEQEAEGYFLKAIEIARQQQAKSLGLRAVVSLGRLWQQLGKREEARQMLAEIYGWFTEGFDTADLREARALLEAMS